MMPSRPSLSFSSLSCQDQASHWTLLLRIKLRIEIVGICVTELRCSTSSNTVHHSMPFPTRCGFWLFDTSSEKVSVVSSHMKSFHYFHQNDLTHISPFSLPRRLSHSSPSSSCVLVSYNSFLRLRHPFLPLLPTAVLCCSRCDVTGCSLCLYYK